MAPGAGKRKVAEDLVRNFDAQRAAAEASSSASTTGKKSTRGGKSTQHGQKAKKPRFDARNPSTLAQSGDPDDDDDDDEGNQRGTAGAGAGGDDEDAAILELDEIGRSGPRTKRNAVRLDGYDTDSSNEGFDARVEEKQRAKKAKEKQKARQAAEDNTDDDMFGDVGAELSEVDDGEPADEAMDRKGKKEVRFVDSRNIDGQVARSRGGRHVSANFKAWAAGDARGDESESDVSSVADEERDRADGVDAELGAGAKKKGAPLLEAFNTKTEASEGRYDEALNFVRKAADPLAVHDAWMEGTSRKEMQRAREAHEKRETQRRRRAVADDAVATSELLDALIQRLEVGETVLEALARYGAQAKKAKSRAGWQQKKKRAKDEDADGEQKQEDGEAEQAEQARKEAVESITSAADQLLTRGQEDVYEVERELLMRQYKRDTGEDWAGQSRAASREDEDKGDAREWEYRWEDARDGGEVHGPYDGTTMASWNDAGYFGEGVQFRERGAQAWRAAVPDFV